MAFSTWQPLKIGAGGQLTGMDVAIDGIKVIRTDTYGAYLWNGSAWVQLVSQSSMPAADFGFSAVDGASPNGGGVYEIAIAPSDTTIFYMLFNGRLFRSANRGTTWTRCTGWSQVTAAPNVTAGVGRKMAIDPQNANVVYIGTPSNGLFVTTDGGSTCTAVAAVATASSTYGYCIAFDPSSAVSGGRTQGVYVSSYGTGVYHTTNAGTAWTLTTATPTTHLHMLCSAAGVLWLTDNAGGSQNLHKYTSSAWTNPNIGSDGANAATIAINGTTIYIGSYGGDLTISTDSGATWTPPTSKSRSASDVPWLAATLETFMSNGDMMWDPSTSRLYFAEGIGVWYSATPAAVNTWTSQSSGIEQLVVNQVIAPPGGKPVALCWDRPVFYISDPDTYRSSHGPNYDHAIVMGWHADYVPTTPTFIVALMNWFGVEESSYSSDGGQTWTNFANFPSLMTDGHVGGSIAAGSTTNFVVVGNNGTGAGGNPYYTTDGGATAWGTPTISGVPTTGETGWIAGYTINRHILCADRVTANKFYMYNHHSNDTIAGIYRSTDSGVSFTRVKAGKFAVGGAGAILRSVPSNAGHLYYTGGNVGGSITGSFYKSTDSGASWAAVPNVTMVWAFGFGKAVSGGYPAVFIAGWVSSVWGIWRSDDADQATPTWTQIGDYPLGSMDFVMWLEGDLDTYGKVYAGFLGSGCAYGASGRRSGLRLGLHS